jgi:hypothetical protein
MPGRIPRVPNLQKKKGRRAWRKRFDGFDAIVHYARPVYQLARNRIFSQDFPGIFIRFIPRRNAEHNPFGPDIRISLSRPRYWLLQGNGMI